MFAGFVVVYLCRFLACVLGLRFGGGYALVVWLGFVLVVSGYLVCLFIIYWLVFVDCCWFGTGGCCCVVVCSWVWVLLLVYVMFVVCFRLGCFRVAGLFGFGWLAFCWR